MISPMIKPVMNHKVAIVGLLLVFLVLIFSCGLFSMPHHGAEGSTAGCELLTSIIQPIISKDTALVFSLLALLALTSFVSAHTFGNLSAKDPPQILITVHYVLRKQKNIVPWIQESFSRGILHTKVYAYNTS